MQYNQLSLVVGLLISIMERIWPEEWSLIVEMHWMNMANMNFNFSDGTITQRFRAEQIGRVGNLFYSRTIMNVNH